MVLHRVCARLARPATDWLLDINDEELSIADAARACGAHDGLDGLVHHIVGKHDFDFHFWQEVHHVFSTAVELRMTLLSSEAFCFGDGDALETHLVKRLLYLIKLEGFYDGFDLLHGRPFRCRSSIASAMPAAKFGAYEEKSAASLQGAVLMERRVLPN